LQSDAKDRQANCDRIHEWLRKNGPIDVCVLGLGVNGHIGFNEPAESLQPHAHVAELSEASLGHSMVHSTRTRPTHGVTLGMADILQSREILMLASGPPKREPIERLLSGAITTAFPASLLQLHPRVTLMCDEAAYAGASAA
jgi:galactosamine-6-phosphate isomerase